MQDPAVYEDSRTGMLSAYSVSMGDWGIQKLTIVVTPQSPISYVTHLYHLPQLLTLHCLTPKIKLVSKRR